MNTYINTKRLKIFVFHKPSVQGHVIDFSDTSRSQISKFGYGLPKPQDLSEYAACDLIDQPAVREEITNSFGKSNCLQTGYSEGDFKLTYFEEL